MRDAETLVPSTRLDDLGRPRNATMSDSAGVTLLGRIMVGTIIVLFFAGVIILCIHIYLKLFWWRRRRGAVRRRFVFVSADGQAAASEGLRSGVDVAVLKSLPVVMISRLEFKDGLECAVCLSELVEGDKARMLPNCNHGFHVECIDMWLHSHSTCPLCRSPVAPPASVQDVNTENSVPLPANVLFWGNETQISAMVVSSDEGASGRRVDSLVIDIPRNNISTNFSSSDTRPHHHHHEMRSPLSSQIRSLTMIWSMNNRVAPSSSSTDMDQGDPIVKTAP